MPAVQLLLELGRAWAFEARPEPGQSTVGLLCLVKTTVLPWTAGGEKREANLIDSSLFVVLTIPRRIGQLLELVAGPGLRCRPAPRAGLKGEGTPWTRLSLLPTVPQVYPPLNGQKDPAK